MKKPKTPTQLNSESLPKEKRRQPRKEPPGGTAFLVADRRKFAAEIYRDIVQLENLDKYRDANRAKCLRWYYRNREARAEDNREYYRFLKLAFPESSRESNIKFNYGISLQCVKDAEREQDGRCAICGIEVVRLQVDHDHATGSFRGMLCGNCNGGLGFFKDSIPALKMAISYLLNANNK